MEGAGKSGNLHFSAELIFLPFRGNPVIVNPVGLEAEGSPAVAKANQPPDQAD
jgi:hypothetical protein